MTLSLPLIYRSLGVFSRHYLKAPIQASAILLGIILAVTLLIGVKATNENAKQSYGNATELLSQRASFYLSNNDQTSIDEGVYFALRRAGIPALAVIEGIVSDPQGRSWKVTGSDIMAAVSIKPTSPPQTASPTSPPPSKSIPLERLLNGHAAVMMSASVVDRVNALAKGPLVLNDIPLELIAVEESLGLGNNMLADISFAQQLLQMPDQLSYIAVFFPKKTDVVDIEAQTNIIINALEDAKLDSRQISINRQDDGESLSALTNSFHLNLDAMSMLAFVVGLFIAYNGVRYSLMKRQKLFIQLLQMGIGRHNLLCALVVEIVLLVVIGSIVGFIMGLQLSQWLQPMVAMTLAQIYGAKLLPGLWQWQWFAQGLGLTLFASLAACWPLLLQLSRVPLAQGGQRQAQLMPFEKLFKRQAFAACLILATTALLFSITTQYKLSLLLLGLVTIAIPLLLPMTINVCVKLILPFMPKGIWHYVVAETKEIIAPLSLAMMAILLALCANISMNTLVGSFEVTLKQWLDARLHADLYIKPNPNAIPEINAWLQAEPKVSAIYQQWSTKAKLEVKTQSSVPINLVSRDIYSIKHTTAFKSPSTRSALFWQQFQQGQTVLISEPLSIKYQLNVGDRIKIDKLHNQSSKTSAAIQTQATPEFIISGIYFDYGNPVGEVIIAPSVWQQHALPLQPISLAVNYQGNIEALQQELITQQGLSSAHMYSQQSIKDEAIKMFTKTFSITVVLNSLTLMVATIGLFSACIMLTQARLAPLARLYALGVSRTQLRVMVTSQMMLIVLFTCLLALPMGAILGYLLINKVTLQAFGWTIAMLWDWPAYGRVVVIAMISCLVAVALPLYWQTRKPLISSLQQESL
ncbi:ABC transporter permease [Shewanella holmiensis]|uniref:FtsX-like permease family protein n=1 Tax=Shewanella holmiensis TaxID=2952222 RepID=A0A9X2WK09_9GAMM|nr:FtsX-like permease family protein [Shewanella holmiensis]MCT7940738.1 FtsX-like permease family protein [Shewanella holmiensis]